MLQVLTSLLRAPAAPPDAGVEAAALDFGAAAAAADADVALMNGSGARAGAIGRSGDPRLDGILSGMRWTQGAISYSAPDSGADYPSGYQIDFNGNGISAQFDGLTGFSPQQQRVLHAALDTHPGLRPAAGAGFAVEGLTNLVITYAGTGSGAGTIRAANSGDAQTAYGLYPSSDPRGGDVYFNAAGRSPVAGNFDYTAILHELGHALGLDHGHTADNFGALPLAWDSFEFSVMTYRSAIGNEGGAITSETWGNPQTFMMLDIAALQYMYGADFTTNAGATRYSWDPATGRSFVDGALALAPGGNRILVTIWDGGGYDTYNLSNYATDLVLNLYPGAASTLSAAQLADLNQISAGGLARGNVFNALQYRGDPRSLIEAAIGGSGNDFLIGNAAANNLFGNGGHDRLVGGHGDDRLFGQEGDDLLRGQAGTDRLVGGPGADALIGGTDPDLFVFTAISDSGPGGRDVILGGDGAVAFEAAGPTWGDRIDVSAIDANLLLPGNQAFVFGTATGIGRLYAVDVGLVTVIRGNVDAGPAPDFEVVIADGAVPASAYTLYDFIL